MKFTAITKDRPAENGNKAFMVAVDAQGREVLVFGEPSQAKVREHVKAVQSNGLDNTPELPGEVRNAQKRDGTGTYLAWSLPDDRRRGGFQQRDPIQEIVGIAHYQAMNLVFEKRPPEDPQKLSAFWDSARPHIRQMAKQIAEDRIELKKELSA